MNRALVVVACLGSACGGTSDLLHGLDERQANDVVAELDRRGIDAEKIVDEGAGRFKVSVLRPDRDRAHDVLAARDLPRTGARGVGETFSEPGLFPSPEAERARLQAAIAADLERTLEAVPGVNAARVLLALPDEEPGRDPGVRGRMTASVLLRTRAQLPLAGDEIRKLVAAAVAGLDAGDVNLSYAVETLAETTKPRDPLARARLIGIAPAILALAVGLFGIVLIALVAAIVRLAHRLRALEKLSARA